MTTTGVPGQYAAAASPDPLHHEDKGTAGGREGGIYGFMTGIHDLR